ncbi:MAG: serpin family protein [Pirellulaceae bacterium]|nr:serpin family protein [Pirellulaceae bacterium]
MDRLRFSMLLLVGCCFGSDAVLAAPQLPAASSVHVEPNRVARRVYQVMSRETPNRNWVLCPYGLTQVVGLLSEGARGKSRNELRNAVLGGNRVGPDVSMESLEEAWGHWFLASASVENQFPGQVVENGRYGVVVTELDAEVAAEVLRPGDLILVANGRPIRSVQEWEAIVRTSQGELVVDGFDSNGGTIFRERHLKMIRKPTVDAETGNLKNYNLFLYNTSLSPSGAFTAWVREVFRGAIATVPSLDATVLASPDVAEWLQQATNQQFGPSAFEGMELNDTQFLLVNLCKFRSAWDGTASLINEFEFRGFEGVQRVAGVSVKGLVESFEWHGQQVIVVPLRDPSFSLRIILPADEGPEGLQQLLANMAKFPVSLEPQEAVKTELQLPILEVANIIERSEIAALLGLEISLSPDANFSEIDSRSVIGSMVQSTRVRLDLQGVMAESVTTVAGVPRGMDRGDYRQLKIDRPFVFEVAHRSGCVIFQGQFVNHQ